ncbi:polyprenyl synthetase family protein [Gemella sp. GH3]|uniref:polyprenyl synthetase family protein n=1 Tax=unclassified Gemella TaxID=2624949 RepID=UPI0015D01DE2|nr:MULTISPECIES: farnesyl diphosphate synthase [unclassified Gemella]MBF0713303.1 polyprenyl synthetase family protein [Gemella sp. GH3.1]NYS50255.1 polyprenyl synthetase family protein [Gemella sp. GH3]
MNNIQNFLEKKKMNINEFAKSYVSNLDIPIDLKNSIEYSLVNEGKKLRPIMFLALLEHYGINSDEYLDIALAIELIHIYSLVHDDLPAMDNDDYRWGKLTNHKVFGVDIAILAGDAMQTLAYEILSDNKKLPTDTKVDLIRILSNSSGSSGMIAGQIYDIKQENYTVDESYLKRMHSLKTGKLITLPLIFAAQIAKKDSKELYLIEQYGYELGIAYQIRDDILDYYGEFEQIGKLPSDENKKTYLSFYGIDDCEKLLNEHTLAAKNIGKKLNNNWLYDFATLLLTRKK